MSPLLADFIELQEQFTDLQSALDETTEERDEYRRLLQEASDHLDYIGWGDSYERELIRENKLPQRIQAALDKGTK